MEAYFLFDLVKEWNVLIDVSGFYLHGCAQVTQGPERPVLAVLTDRDLLLYSSLPDSKESLNSPTKSHPLITTRLSETAGFFSGTCNAHVSVFCLCNHFASSSLSRFGLIDLSLAFFWHRQQEHAHSFHYGTVWKTRVKPESMTHIFPQFKLTRTFHV